MNKLITFFTIFGIFAGRFFSVKAQNSDDPAKTLSAYYSAINGKKYKRAYDYWRTPKENFENFSKGYAETKKVRLITEKPLIEGAAGSLYAQVPTVLVSTMRNGKKQTFSGCYTLNKSNLRPPDIPKTDTWHIYNANLKAASNDAKIPELLANACAENSDTPQEDQKSSRVLGVIAVGDEADSETISVPATITANKDFEITVNTSGNGCVNAADTSVILGESSADVFVYDYTSANRPGIACTMIFKTLPHKATLRFTEKGEATIRIWGRKQGGDSPLGEPVILIRRVTVK